MHDIGEYIKIIKWINNLSDHSACLTGKKNILFDSLPKC